MVEVTIQTSGRIGKLIRLERGDILREGDLIGVMPVSRKLSASISEAEYKALVPVTKSSVGKEVLDLKANGMVLVFFRSPE